MHITTQVQLQMKVCQADYCDFVVWRPTEIAVIGIIPNKTFIDSAIDQATKFYKFGVLPELIGKWYSKISTFSSSDSSLQIATNISNETVSTTNDEEHGTMIGCDNENVQLAGFILIVSKFKISLLEIGIVQTVGRIFMLQWR